MTEDEAKEKWCPMVRILSAAKQTAYNRFSDPTYDPPNNSECIASDCMMWVDVADTLRTTGADPGCFPSGRCGLAR